MDDIFYDLTSIEQPDDFSCWAATLAMVASASLTDGTFYTPQQVIEYAEKDQPGRFTGPIGWPDIQDALARWGLNELAPADWTPEGWATQLYQSGPLGLVVKPDGNPDGLYHAIVLCGITGAGTIDGEGTDVIVNDPRPGAGRGRIAFNDFVREWDFGAAANATIMIDPLFVPGTGASTPTSGIPAPSADAFAQYLDSAPTSDVVDGPEPVTADPLPEGTIGGTVTEAVNAGVTLVKLVANSASVQVDRSRVASALPAGTTAGDLLDWAGPRRISRRFRTADSDWWEIWLAEYDFAIGVQFLFNGRRDKRPGQYLDDILVFLEVTALPADFSISATAHFPATCHMFGTTTPVAGMPFTVDLEVKGVFGQVVSWSRNLAFNLFGDGRVEIV